MDGQDDNIQQDNTKKKAPLKRDERATAAKKLATVSGVSSFMLHVFLESTVPDVKAVHVHDVKTLASFVDAKDDMKEREKMLDDIVHALCEAHGIAKGRKMTLDQDKKRLALLYKHVAVLGQVGDPALARYEVGVTIAPTQADFTNPKYFRPLSVRTQKHFMLRSDYTAFMSFKGDTTADRNAAIGSLELDDPDDPDAIIQAVRYPARVVAHAIFDKLLSDAKESGSLPALLLSDDPAPVQPIQVVGDPAVPRAPEVGLVSKTTVKKARTSKGKEKEAKQQQADVPEPSTKNDKQQQQQQQPETPEADNGKQGGASALPSSVPVDVPTSQVVKKKKNKKKTPASDKLDMYVNMERTHKSSLLGLQIHAKRAECIVPGPLDYTLTREDELNSSFFPVNFALDPVTLSADVQTFMTTNTVIDSYEIIGAAMVRTAKLEFVAHRAITYLRTKNITVQTGTLEHAEALMRADHSGGRTVAIEACVTDLTASEVSSVMEKLTPVIQQTSRPLRDLVGAADRILCIRQTVHRGTPEEPSRCAYLACTLKKGDKCYLINALVGSDIYAAYVRAAISRTDIPKLPLERITPLKRGLKEALERDLVATTLGDVDTEKDKVPPVPAVFRSFVEIDELPFWAFVPEAWNFAKTPAPLGIRGNAVLMDLCRAAVKKPPDNHDALLRETISQERNGVKFLRFIDEKKREMDSLGSNWLACLVSAMGQFIQPIPVEDVASALTTRVTEQSSNAFRYIETLYNMCTMPKVQAHNSAFFVKTGGPYSPLQLAIARVIFVPLQCGFVAARPETQ